MMHKCWVLAISFALSACGWFEENPVQLEQDDWVPILAKNQGFWMGCAQESCPAEEKPAFYVHFDYDFKLARREVTRGEYALWDSSYRGQDSLPATGMNALEAMLYCNFLSKRFQLDTVYSYERLERDGRGRVVALVGLYPKWLVDGYRLPLEAEWEYAASGGWWTEENVNGMAWTSRNSQGQLHPVGTLSPNSRGVYDLLGNAMEWSGGWKGAYPTDTTLDFVGSTQPNGLLEMALKGGSYRHAPSRLSARSDAYPAGALAQAEYLGFRVARGPIPSPHSNGGTWIKDAPRVAFTADDWSKWKSGPAALVFVDKNAGQLAWVDLQKPELGARYLAGTEGMFHPVISPDGQWVAYGDRPEGVAGVGSVYVRALRQDTAQVFKYPLPSAALPRWWKSPEGLMYLIVAEDAATNGDSAAWASRSTWKASWDGQHFGTPELLRIPGTFSGGFSPKLDFWASGYVALRTWDGSQTRLLFQDGANGKPLGSSTQVCNVSVAPDASKNLLFVDFGSEGVSSWVGRSYGVHEYLFVTDSAAHLRRWIAPPAGDVSWNYPEWSTDPAWAVASSVDAADRPHAIWALRMRDTGSIRLVEGENLWMPSLWVQGAAGVQDTLLDGDSAGRYADPAPWFAFDEWQQRMARFWAHGAEMEALALGSSRMSYGIETGQLKSFKTMNMAFPGGDLHFVHEFLFNYGFRHVPKLKFLFLSLEIEWWNWAPGQSHWSGGIVYTKGFQYDQNHGFWPAGAPAALAEWTANASSPNVDHYRQAVDSLGNINTVGDLNWGGMPPKIEGDLTWGAGSSSFAYRMGMLKRILDTCAARGIQVLGVVYPMAPAYAQTNSFGIYGPQRDSAKVMLDLIQNLQNTYTNFKFYDANLFGAHDYPEGESQNADHLNGLGRARMTPRLDSIALAWKLK